jgi:hypothetical protein
VSVIVGPATGYALETYARNPSYFNSRTTLSCVSRFISLGIPRHEVHGATRFYPQIEERSLAVILCAVANLADMLTNSDGLRVQATWDFQRALLVLPPIWFHLVWVNRQLSLENSQ